MPLDHTHILNPRPGRRCQSRRPHARAVIPEHDGRRAVNIPVVNIPSLGILQHPPPGGPVKYTSGQESSEPGPVLSIVLRCDPVLGNYKLVGQSMSRAGSENGGYLKCRFWSSARSEE